MDTSLDPSSSDRPVILVGSDAPEPDIIIDPDGDHGNRLGEVIDSIHYGVLFYGAGGIEVANRAAVEMLGPDLGQLHSPASLHELAPVHPDGTPFPPHGLPHFRTMETGEPATGVVVGLLVGDRERRWFKLHTRPRLEDGRLIGAVLSFSDITDQKTAEDLLRDSEANSRSMIDSLHEGVIVHDFERVLAANASATRIIGVPDEEAMTLDWLRKAVTVHGDGTPVDDEDRPSVRALVTGEPQYGVLRGVQRPDGEMRWCLLNAIPLFHADSDKPYASVLSFSDITDRKTVEDGLRESEARFRGLAKSLTHQATHDGLTDLPNRTLLLAELDDALASASATETLLALLFLDLDRFKAVNDSLGHDAGDELLIEAARRISSVLRPGDLVARLGGDEFVVVCRDVTSERQAAAIAQRIMTSIESAPIVLGAHELAVTASVGVALSDGGTAHPESLLRDADAAMYRAKDLGRARLELFDESMRRRTLVQVEVAEQLALAIEHGEIIVHYQPCISLTDGKVTCLEALARWRHPTRGILSPKEFIEIAEETGQIVGLGLQVLTRASQQGNKWEMLLGSDAPRIHVNLSARQLSATNIPDLVSGVLERTGLSPNKLCLEITESVLMEDAAGVIDTLYALKALGVVLAIDDFGTGYSSLSYLRKFPVDVIKVDQSFVDGLGPDPEDSAIVAAIIGLAHTLDLEAIAEGVESAEQLERLRELGCHNAQGFVFAEPQPADEITPLLTVFSAAERLRQR